MSEVVYVSKSRIECKQGPLRVAYLPGESHPLFYSVHGVIAEHYKVDPRNLRSRIPRQSITSFRRLLVEWLVPSEVRWTRAPTHRKIHFETVDVMRIQNGKITGHWAVGNLLSLLQQIGGWIPPAEE